VVLSNSIFWLQRLYGFFPSIQMLCIVGLYVTSRVAKTLHSFISIVNSYYYLSLTHLLCDAFSRNLNSAVLFILNPFQPTDAMWRHTFHLSLICLSFALWFSSHPITMRWLFYARLYMLKSPNIWTKVPVLACFVGAAGMTPHGITVLERFKAYGLN
jgi:hypothetical protein